MNVMWSSLPALPTSKHCVWTSFVPSYGIRHLVLYYDSNDNYVEDDGDHGLDDHTGYDDDLDGDDDNNVDLVNAQL